MPTSVYEVAFDGFKAEFRACVQRALDGVQDANDVAGFFDLLEIEIEAMVKQYLGVD